MNTDQQKTRVENFRLLCHLIGNQKRVAQKLEGSYKNDLSSYNLGKKPLRDYVARAIEIKLGFPEGWLDRDNLGLINCPPADFKLLECIRSLPLEKKHALETLLCNDTTNHPEPSARGALIPTSDPRVVPLRPLVQ